MYLDIVTELEAEDILDYSIYYINKQLEEIIKKNQSAFYEIYLEYQPEAPEVKVIKAAPSVEDLDINDPTDNYTIAMMKDIQSKYTLINFQLLLAEIDTVAEIVKLYMIDNNLLFIYSYTKNTSNLVVLAYQALETFTEQKS